MSAQPSGVPAGAGREGSGPVPVTIVAHDVGSVGGMERQLAELAVGLRGLGHDVTVVARKCVLPAGSGVSFHRVRAPGRPFLLAYPWFLLAGSLALRRARRGVVQSTGPLVLNGVDTIAVHYCHCAYRASPERAGHLYALYDWAVGVLERGSEAIGVRRNRSARFVCVSEGVAEEVRRCFPAVAANVVTIHNGVDVEEFAPGAGAEEGRALRAELGIPPGGMLAAFVGGDWERKGLGPAIEALALAPGWHLAVAGRGAQRAFAELAASLGVQERVHWLGVREDVRPLYAAADAFVLPSRYETFSLVTFEAAASGLPVIAADVNGVRELIRSGENGYLVAPAAEPIAARLRELGADEALRSRLGAAARQAALGFGWERMVRAHHELFEALAAGST
ncbi:MAG TPA: glycosyltransferase family 4 protein [Solirubrobacteraceae bacterium]|nr:glycosyltransferase family 4 protein [Solirubrobacteraceae bacterium]